MPLHQQLAATLHRHHTKNKENRTHRLTFTPHHDIRLTTLATLLWGTTLAGFHYQWHHTFTTAVTAALCLTLLSSYIAALHTKLHTLAPTLAVTAATLLLQLCLIHTTGIAESSQTYAALNDHPVRITGTVTRTKRISNEKFLVEISADTVSARGQTYPGKRKITAFLHQTPAHGHPIKLLGTITTHGATITLNRAHLSPETPPRTTTPQHFKDTLATHLSALIGKNPAGLTLGMSYGDDSPLTPQARQDFKISGLTHLTAVSGSNISLIFLLTYRLGQHLHIPRTPLIILGFSTTTLYATFVGWEGSVTRSWAMGSIGALALILGHGKHIAAFLSSCLLPLLFLHPDLSHNLGFALSALATASLIFLAPAISRLLSPFLPLLIAEALAVPAAAALWCAPVLALLQDQLGSYTVPANLLVAPLVPAITVLGLLIALCHLTGLSALLIFLAQPAGLLAQCVIAVSSFFADAPGSTIHLAYLHAGTLPILAIAICLSLLVFAADALVFGKDKRHPHARKVSF